MKCSAVLAGMLPIWCARPLTSRAAAGLQLGSKLNMSMVGVCEKVKNNKLHIDPRIWDPFVILLGFTEVPHRKHLASEAGIKSELAKSANYPRDFGLAIAALVPARGRRPVEESLDLTYQGTDHLGSLDDFFKGAQNTKWRKPTFTG